MVHQPSEKLIVKMAERLIEKRVDSQAIRDALDLICEAFLFDCGLVYEIDQTNRLELKERCMKRPMELREQFHVDEIEPAYRMHAAQNGLLSMNKAADNTPCEGFLLDFFFATSVALFSVVDEKTRIYGFIVFANHTSHSALTDDDEKLLHLLLSMLGRYIGLRIYQIKLDFSRSSLENILDNTGIDIYVNDFYTHDILYVNKSMAAPYGGANKFSSRKCWEVLFPGQNGPCEFCPQTKIIDEEGNPTKIHSWDYQRPFDGAWFRVFSSAFRWVDGRLAHVVSSANITDNKRNEALIQFMANYDALTGLPNRRKLVTDCEKRITQIRTESRGYLLFFDIDGFKAINDNLGHDAGDEFLVQLGAFFAGIPMLREAIYRNGGDEFVALVDNNPTRENIENLAAFIHRRFTEPWELKKGHIYCNTSIGAACYPDDGDTAETLLLKADQAMYAVKKKGGGHVAFAAGGTGAAGAAAPDPARGA